MDGLYIIKGIKAKALATPALTEEIKALINQAFDKTIEIGHFLWNADTYVMIRQQSLVALAQIEYVRSKKFWLQHVCTHLDQQRKGYMTALLKTLMADAKARYPRLRKLYLEVHDSRPVAKALYTKLGFAIKKRARRSTVMIYKYPKVK